MTEEEEEETSSRIIQITGGEIQLLSPERFPESQAIFRVTGQPRGQLKNRIPEIKKQLIIRVFSLESSVLDILER